MRFPTILAPIMRERAVCASMVTVGAAIVVANRFGITLWKCAFREVTGLPCPGCGLTRGLGALAKSDVHQMMHWNPFSPAFAVAALLMLLAAVLPQRPRQRLITIVETVERSLGLTLLVLVALLLFGFYRMVKGPYV